MTFSFNEMYGSKYLSAADIGNREIPVVVSKVRTETMTDRQTGASRPRIIIGFEGKTKELPLNATNARELAKGTNTEDFFAWEGTPVVLYTAATALGDGVRIRVQRQQRAANVASLRERERQFVEQAEAHAMQAAPAANEFADEVPF